MNNQNQTDVAEAPSDQSRSVRHISDVADTHQAAVAHWTPDGEVLPHSGVPSEEAVIEAIATVHDPEIPVNIYELGLIYAIDLHDDGRVKVEMTLTAPNCPSAQELPVQVREAIEKVKDVTSAEVDVVWDPPWDMSRMSDEARLALNMF
ncbi:SUF system Fe-S cluster assembly protein [Acetobacter sp. LMG 1636]|uniref:SUF system Fe-S cluster assembly protein n=1 Tax=Acetobacter fallax TaxID=1737473 RepID=A0ABX0K9Y9_9PROT|nr:SUF system Fe-S cluster assembly protein [Acetobacter fallax]NHO35809.1 SUF system Fe-S cluster assembly protein [Acetobacter fallax]